MDGPSGRKVKTEGSGSDSPSRKMKTEGSGPDGPAKKVKTEGGDRRQRGPGGTRNSRNGMIVGYRRRRGVGNARGSRDGIIAGRHCGVRGSSRGSIAPAAMWYNLCLGRHSPTGLV